MPTRISASTGHTRSTRFPKTPVFHDLVFLNYAPAWTARTFGLRGPCTSLTTGCTAGIDALGLGFDLGPPG